MKHKNKREIPLILKDWRFLFVPVLFFLVVFAGQLHSSSEKRRIENLIQSQLSKYTNYQINLVYEDKISGININDLGINFDQKVTSENIYRICRDSIFYQNWLCSIRSIFKKTVVKPVFSIDFSKLNETLDKHLSSAEIKATNAHIIFDKGKFRIAPAVNGKLIDRSSLISDLRVNLENFSDKPVQAHLIEEEPLINEALITNQLDTLNMVEKKNIVLVFGYDKWNLSGSELLNIINTEHLADLDSNSIDLKILANTFRLSAIKSGAFDKTPLVVNLDEVKVDTYIESIAKVIDRPTKDAVLSFENGKVTAFNAALDGQLLARDELKKLLLNRILADTDVEAVGSVINLPVVTTRAKISNNEINSLGIRELIGSGVSYFAGSIPNRISNIALGSKLISGTLVKPGETFSFVNMVGAVSADQGFKQAYVINKGKTVLDDGGGICQVSTTVFRAALNSGLPILKRTAHAYRVGYYEQHGFKPGLDATIFSPSVDFQFKNDTENHILVQAVVDRVNSKLQVDIFGTNDGRRVELSNVSVTNTIPAPEPLYQDDLTLPTGTVKQAEYAANGATTIFTRKVFKGGQVVIDESFKSVFRPWQAVYLVGKG